MKTNYSLPLMAALITAVFISGCKKTVENRSYQPPVESGFEMDTFKTTLGDLTITFIGHGTLMMTCNDKVIHIDPWTNLADYAQLPKADLILITHEHGDHLDPAAIAQLRKETTSLVLTKQCAQSVQDGQVLENGQTLRIKGFEIEAVPAYNLVHKNKESRPFHPKGVGNGYIITFGKTRVYIAGDTENTPEMKALRDIDIAFLPMNLPYTMTPEMAADAAVAFRPKILYPYHYGQTDPQALVNLLSDQKDIQVRIRKLQ